MPLNPQSPSVHNQMITRFIKHPKSTNFDGEQDKPTKRPKTGDSPKKAPPTPRKKIKRQAPELEGHDERVELKVEEEDHVTDLESALPHVTVSDDAIKEYEAYKASQEGETEAADKRLENRTWIRGKSSLYVDAFNLALDTVLDEEGHLFDEAEADIFRIWRGLNYEAQYLWVSTANGLRQN